jgi:epoxide hydrolase-like predicted phosphatase
MYKAVIFDFFDVIHGDPFKRWLKTNGLERSGDFEASSQLVDLGHISEDEFHERLSRLSGTSLAGVKEIFDDRSVIDKDMVRLVKELRGHYKIGLLSNASSEYLRALLAHHELAELFDEIAVSSEVGFIKPGPEIFQHILQKLAVKPEETLFIDDNPHNAEAAAALGFGAITFTDYRSLRKELLTLNIVTK